MSNELIVIKQLPVIEERLKQLSVEIDVKVENAKKLVCTEENVKTIKQIRADLNKEFKEVEQQRKTVKEQVLAPYMQFEEVYKQYVSDKYKNADSDLKSKIDSIESELKLKKEQDVREYFEEYKESKDVDFITYEQARINVTLTASMKSLKEQCKTFIDKIVDDLNLIEVQNCKEEILIEYKQDLNVSKAIQTVANRHKALEEARRKQEELVNEKLKAETIATKEALENFKIEAPVVEETQEDVLTLKFTVKATRTKLKALKEFLENGGYDYE